MRTSSIAAVAALSMLAVGVMFGGAISAHAQDDATPAHAKVFGYQDSRTGAFHALNRVVPEATITPTTGSFTVTITISLKTAVPAGGSVLCTTEIGADSTNLMTASIVTYEETAYNVAKVTGSTATCTVTTPYSWILPAASTTVETLIHGGYSVSILPSSSSTASLAAFAGRTSSSDFLSLTKVPATGTVTKNTVSVTL